MDRLDRANRRYEKIGGWLYLVAVGVVLNPVRLSVLVGRDLLPAFSSQTWSVLTTPGTAVYHPLWAPLLIGELVGNLVFIVFALVVAVTFFQKRRAFPGLISVFLMANMIFVAGDYFVANMIPFVKGQGDVGATRELIRSVIACAIWVPYFRVSKRVQGTFVR